jgi:ribonuclease P protein component
MTPRFTFEKKERLSHRKQIDRLFNEGDQFNLYPYKIFFQVNETPEDAPAQILIAIPKKKFRHAVDRNRIRRVTREAYRLHRHILTDSLITKSTKLQIGIVYIGSSAAIGLADIEGKLIGCLKKLIEVTS